MKSAIIQITHTPHCSYGKTLDGPIPRCSASFGPFTARLNRKYLKLFRLNASHPSQWRWLSWQEEAHEKRQRMRLQNMISFINSLTSSSWMSRYVYLAACRWPHMIYFYHVYYSIIMSKRRGVLAGTQKIKKTSETYLCIYVHRGVGNYTRNIENL